MSYFYINLSKEVTERFSLSKFFEFTDNEDVLTSYFYERVTKLRTQGKYTVQGEDGRPDLVSSRIYGDPQYWWIILAYNKQYEFDLFKTGDVVSYPSLSDVEDLYFSLKGLQTAVEAQST